MIILPVASAFAVRLRSLQAQHKKSSKVPAILNHKKARHTHTKTNHSNLCQKNNQDNIFSQGAKKRSKAGFSFLGFMSLLQVIKFCTLINPLRTHLSLRFNIKT